MILTDTASKYFSLIPFKVRAAAAKHQAPALFTYEDEDFFVAYEALGRRRVKGGSQRSVANDLCIGRDHLRLLESRFNKHGTIGLLPEVGKIDVDPRLERLAVLVKSARPHEHASLTLRLADALEIPGASLNTIRNIQRSYGYGQSLNIS